METIDDSLNRIGFGRFHFYLLFILASNAAIFGLQITTMSFLGPVLSCVWKLKTINIFTLNTVLFIGKITGSLFIGRFSDKYGRKTALVLSNSLFIYSNFMSAVSHDIYWLTVFYLFIGISVVGIPLTIFPLFFEWSPARYRIVFIGIAAFTISFGCFLGSILGYVIIPRFGWRILIAISVVLTIIIAIFLIPIPESPRYLMLNKGKFECLRVMNTVAKWNKAETIKDMQEPPITKYNIKDLIHPNYLSTTILVSLISLVNYLTYYSIVLIIPIIANIPHRCLQNWNRFSTVQVLQKNNTFDDSCCMKLNIGNYNSMLISTSAEIVFIPFYLILINLIGRKKTIPIFLFIIMIGIISLNFCLNFLQLNILLFIIRGISSLSFNLIMIYAPEIFPTSVRSFGMGICSAVGRIGGALSPLIANIIIFKYSFFVGTMIMFVLNLLCFCVTFLLPYETKDQNLQQTAEERNKVE